MHVFYGGILFDSLNVKLPFGVSMLLLAHLNHNHNAKTNFIPTRNLLVPVHHLNLVKSRPTTLPCFKQPRHDPITNASNNFIICARSTNRTRTWKKQHSRQQKEKTAANKSLALARPFTTKPKPLYVQPIIAICTTARATAQQQPHPIRTKQKQPQPQPQ